MNEGVTCCLCIYGKIEQIVISPPPFSFKNYIETGGCKHKYKAYKRWNDGLLETEPTPRH